ncbi:hypothetical protein LguiB_021356 [Lonicera macranthoides]
MGQLMTMFHKSWIWRYQAEHTNTCWRTKYWTDPLWGHCEECYIMSSVMFPICDIVLSSDLRSLWLPTYGLACQALSNVALDRVIIKMMTEHTMNYVEETLRGQRVEIIERTLEGASTPSKDLISFVCAYRRGVVISTLRTTTTEGSDPSYSLTFNNGGSSLEEKMEEMRASIMTKNLPYYGVGQMFKSPCTLQLLYPINIGEYLSNLDARLRMNTRVDISHVLHYLSSKKLNLIRKIGQNERLGIQFHILKRLVHLQTHIGAKCKEARPMEHQPRDPESRGCLRGPREEHVCDKTIWPQLSLQPFERLLKQSGCLDECKQHLVGRALVHVLGSLRKLLKYHTKVSTLSSIYHQIWHYVMDPILHQPYNVAHHQILNASSFSLHNEPNRCWMVEGAVQPNMVLTSTWDIPVINTA